MDSLNTSPSPPPPPPPPPASAPAPGEERGIPGFAGANLLVPNTAPQAGQPRDGSATTLPGSLGGELKAMELAPHQLPDWQPTTVRPPGPQPTTVYNPDGTIWSYGVTNGNVVPRNTANFGQSALGQVGARFRPTVPSGVGRGSGQGPSGTAPNLFYGQAVLPTGQLPLGTPHPFHEFPPGSVTQGTSQQVQRELPTGLLPQGTPMYYPAPTNVAPPQPPPASAPVEGHERSRSRKRRRPTTRRYSSEEDEYSSWDESPDRSRRSHRRRRHPRPTPPAGPSMEDFRSLMKEMFQQERAAGKATPAPLLPMQPGSPPRVSPPPPRSGAAGSAPSTSGTRSRRSPSLEIHASDSLSALEDTWQDSEDPPLLRHALPGSIASETGVAPPSPREPPTPITALRSTEEPLATGESAASEIGSTEHTIRPPDLDDARSQTREEDPRDPPEEATFPGAEDLEQVLNELNSFFGMPVPPPVTPAESTEWSRVCGPTGTERKQPLPPLHIDGELLDRCQDIASSQWTSYPRSLDSLLRVPETQYDTLLRTPDIADDVWEKLLHGGKAKLQYSKDGRARYQLCPPSRQEQDENLKKFDRTARFGLKVTALQFRISEWQTRSPRDHPLRQLMGRLQHELIKRASDQFARIAIKTTRSRRAIVTPGLGLSGIATGELHAAPVVGGDLYGGLFKATYERDRERNKRIAEDAKASKPASQTPSHRNRQQSAARSQPARPQAVQGRQQPRNEARPQQERSAGGARRGSARGHSSGRSSRARGRGRSYRGGQ